MGSPHPLILGDLAEAGYRGVRILDAAILCEELPGLQPYHRGGERTRCPEMHFQPTMVDEKASGHQGTTYQSITKYKVLTCKYVYVNAVPSDGTTMRPASVNTRPRS